MMTAVVLASLSGAIGRTLAAVAVVAAVVLGAVLYVQIQRRRHKHERG